MRKPTAVNATLAGLCIAFGAFAASTIPNDPTPPQDPAYCHSDGWCVTDCDPVTGFLAHAEDDPCWSLQIAPRG